MRGDQADVIVGGEVDLSTAQAFRDALFDAVGRGPAVVVVDAREVAYLDSTGVHALYDAAEAARAAGVSLRIVHARPAVLRVLELSGVTEVLRVDGD